MLYLQLAACAYEVVMLAGTQKGAQPPLLQGSAWQRMRHPVHLQQYHRCGCLFSKQPVLTCDQTSEAHCILMMQSGTCGCKLHHTAEK